MSRAPDRIVLDALAAEERRVLSDWRAQLYLRRAAARGELAGQPAPDAVAVDGLLEQMVRSGELRPVEGLPNLFEATPYSALASISALVFHGVSYQFPRHIVAVSPEPRPRDFLPLDTTAADWVGGNQPPIRTPDTVKYARMDWR